MLRAAPAGRLAIYPREIAQPCWEFLQKKEAYRYEAECENGRNDLTADELRSCPADPAACARLQHGRSLRSADRLGGSRWNLRRSQYPRRESGPGWHPRNLHPGYLGTHLP